MYLFSSKNSYVDFSGEVNVFKVLNVTYLPLIYIQSTLYTLQILAKSVILRTKDILKCKGGKTYEKNLHYSRNSWVGWRNALL